MCLPCCQAPLLSVVVWLLLDVRHLLALRRVATRVSRWRGAGVAWRGCTRVAWRGGAGIAWRGCAWVARGRSSRISGRGRSVTWRWRRVSTLLARILERHVFSSRM
ncbi:hypothetical protein V8C86DRAFT_2735988 [Haematococcus lacustris]